MDYDYGNKRQWRRWLWNRIAERVNDRSNALVLFLAGNEAFDIEYASRKGFRPRNMIAVEKNQRTADRLRGMGVLVIQEDILTVLKTWPQNKPISVVLGDFCCGLEKRILRDLSLIGGGVGAAFCNTVFAFNFLRGRDASSNKDRNDMNFGRGEFATKHRGALFFNSVMVNSVRAVIPKGEFLPELEIKIFGELITSTRLDLQSYRSSVGGQIFDSLVYQAPWGRFFKEWQIDLDTLLNWNKRHSENESGTKRKIAAVLAHHTRRNSAFQN